jgi:hypothetical protein
VFQLQRTPLVFVGRSQRTLSKSSIEALIDGSADIRAVPLIVRAQKPRTDVLQTKTKIGQFGQALW